MAKDRIGEVTEWFKERAWKVRTPHKGVEGSNPSLSAKGKSLVTSALQRFFYVDRVAESFTHKATLST